MARYRFSANTGYLWKELPFPDRIRQAAAHGFDGVEFHDEAQSEDRDVLIRVLSETKLPVFSMNVRMGESFGCAANLDAAEQAQRDIAHAAQVARDIGAGAIHVLSGITSGPDAHDAFARSLEIALNLWDGTVLIEPISHHAIPGYFLRRIDQAAEIVSGMGEARLKILFDCFHIWSEGGDVAREFAAHANRIGHVQIAAAENRAEPFPGELDYETLLPAFRAQGYDGPFGCEYRPTGRVEDGLDWQEPFTG